MNHYPRHIGDYLRDTGHLTLLEHGVYGRLLDLYYLQEGPIDGANMDLLARKLSARRDDEIAALVAILDEFFTLVDGKWHHKRVDAELAKYREFSRRQSDRALKRYGKDATGMPPAEKPHATNPPSVEKPHANREPRTNNQEPTLPSEVRRTRVKSENSELPGDWQPTEEHAVIARAEGKDVAREAVVFRDYHTARGNKFKRWNQAFNSWLRNPYGKPKDDHRTEKRNREFNEDIVIPAFKPAIK